MVEISRVKGESEWERDWNWDSYLWLKGWVWVQPNHFVILFFHFFGWVVDFTQVIIDRASERETRVGKGCGWVVDLTGVILDRVSERETRVGKGYGWVVDLTRVILERVRETWVEKGCGWVVDLRRVILDRVSKSETRVGKGLWLSGWSHTSDIRKSEQRRD